MKIRLDKFISNQLNIPRSMARTQIKRGKVTVDGEIIRDFAFSFDPELSKIRYKNEAVSYKEHLYLYINKPKGVISATEDKQKQLSEGRVWRPSADSTATQRDFS